MVELQLHQDLLPPEMSHLVVGGSLARVGEDLVRRGDHLKPIVAGAAAICIRVHLHGHLSIGVLRTVAEEGGGGRREGGGEK